MDYVVLNKKEKKQVIFSGCGGMIAYYFGVAKYLQENYDLDNIIFGGVSGGSIISTFLSLNHDIEEIYLSSSKYMCCELDKCKTGALFNTINIIKSYLTKYFGENCDCCIYDKLKDNLFISVSFLYPKQNTIIHKWHNNNDLINCILSSCGLPLLDKCIVRSYRNSYCIDGALFNNNPRLYSELPILKISPYKWRIPPLNWYLFSSKLEHNNMLFKLGYDDARNNSGELDNYFDKKKMD